MDSEHAQCDHCGAPLAADFSFCPACGQTIRQVTSGENTVALLQEVRALRGLQNRSLQRLERLETLLASARQQEAAGDAPAGAFVESEEEFTFQDASERPFQESVQPPASPGGKRPFKYAPGDRPAEPSASASKDRPLPSVPQPAARQQTRESFESAFGQKWLLGIGVAVLLFGVGYFLKYTFAKGWIGPSGQLSLAYVFSALLLGAGEWTRRRGYSLFGVWLFGGGMASVYFTTFAGHRLFELMGHGPAFGVLCAVTLATVALALLHEAPGLAVLGLLGGYATPFVLDGLDGNMFFLLGFVTVLNAGVLSVSLFKRWNGLNWMGLVASYMVFAWWFFSEYISMSLWTQQDGAFWVGLVFVNLTFLGYATAPLLSRVLRRHESGEILVRGTVWLGCAASYPAALWSLTMLEDRYGQPWTALPLLGYALVFAALIWLVKASRTDTDARPGPDVFSSLSPLQVHAGFFFLVAAPLLVDAHWITATWSIQGVALIWVGILLHARSLSGKGLNVLGQGALLLALLRLLLLDLKDSWGLLTHSGLETLQGSLYTYYGGYTKMLPERFVVEALVLAGLFAGAWLAGRLAGERGASSATRSMSERRAGVLMRLSFGTGLFAVLSFECAAFFGETAPAARAAAVSALWAMYATGLLVHGFRHVRRGARVAALLLYGVTLFKVVLVDMESFATPYRILSFLILGGLLVGGSFLYHRHKQMSESREAL